MGSFNLRLRDECFNETLFSTLSETRSVLVRWRHDYDHVGPHSALAKRTPGEFRTLHLTHVVTSDQGQKFNPGISR